MLHTICMIYYICHIYLLNALKNHFQISIRMKFFISINSLLCHCSLLQLVVFKYWRMMLFIGSIILPNQNHPSSGITTTTSKGANRSGWCSNQHHNHPVVHRALAFRHPHQMVVTTPSLQLLLAQ